MANICEYQMKVKGTEENVKKFEEIMLNEDTNKKYIYGISSCVIDFEYTENKITEMDCSGTCRWSVYSSMCEGEHTYYNDVKEQEGDNCMATTLKIESGLLDLDIEIYSDEPGMGFQEHFIFRKGIQEVNECEDIDKGGFEPWEFAI